MTADVRGPIGPGDHGGPIGACPRCEFEHGPDDPRLCARCGHVHNPAKCPRHGRDRDGVIRPCRKYRRRNAPVCESHGADAPQVQAKAEQRAEAAAVEATITRLPRRVRRIDNPLEAAREYAGEVLGWYELAAEKASALAEWTVGENAIPRGELVLLQRFMAECRQTLDAVGRLNVDERLAAIQERHLRLIEAVFRAAVAELGLSPEQEARVPAALRAAVGSVRVRDERAAS